VQILTTASANLLDVYYKAFPNDRVFLKVAVAVLYAIGLAQSLLAFADVYNLAGAVTCTESLVFASLHIWFTVLASSAIGT
jgi:hypothetical protein